MKINARDCSIKEVSLEEAKRFLEENHNQGYSKARLNIGLYRKNELIQIMTFDNPRFNKNYQFELIRDCTKKNYEIRGGVSKLWKYFIENNNVISCICYSYPHNKKDLYTNKYVDYCGFKNIKKAKPAKKIYFEGIWNDELKRIDKSILERHGVDRLLGGFFGQDRTNEQILLDLGFEKKYEEGLDPQVDSYFPFGVLYKITDLDTNHFYIGQTKRKEIWEKGYPGSGTLWSKHYNKYKDIHKFKREILKDNFKTPKDLFNSEVNEIRKYCKYNKQKDKWEINDKLCLNLLTELGNGCPGFFKKSEPCPECGNKAGSHKETCSHYNNKLTCSECGGLSGNHKSTCSKYIKPKNCCPYCGTLPGGIHKKECMNYKEIVCSECGGKQNKHRKECSKYKAIDKIKCCEFCGTPPGGRHKKDCPNFTITVCEECGHLPHVKSCSKYKTKEICKECGSIGVTHKKTCSKYVFPKKKACPECGSKSSHKKSCSHFKKYKVCSECGGLRGNHRKICSKYNH